jgi:Na+/melibiose symporter-like transporter
VFFFYHIVSGFLLWRYYFGDWAMMAVYATTLPLMSTTGALLAPFVLRFLKDTKKGMIFSLVGQAAVYVVLVFVISPEAMMFTLVAISIAMFFNGLSDAFMQPLFAHGADYSNLKSGNRDYGLNMAAFALSVTTGGLGNTTSRTWFLARAGYDGATLNAAATRILEGVTGFVGPPVPTAMAYLRSTGLTQTQAAAQIVPDAVMSVARHMHSTYPLIIVLVIIAVLVFVYPLNDQMAAENSKILKEQDAERAAALKAKTTGQ